MKSNLLYDKSKLDFIAILSYLEVPAMAKITSVTPSAEYRLTICLDNNNAVMLDMGKKLLSIRFSELRDERVFEAVETDGKLVYWPGGFSMDIKEILEIAVK